MGQEIRKFFRIFHNLLKLGKCNILSSTDLSITVDSDSYSEALVILEKLGFKLEPSRKFYANEAGKYRFNIGLSIGQNRKAPKGQSGVTYTFEPDVF